MFRTFAAIAFLSCLLVGSTNFLYAQKPVSSEPQTSASEPLQVGGNVLPPKLISSVEPKYPRPLFHKPRPGMVLVGLIVESDGTLKDIHVVKSGGASFDKSALEAVKQYKFEPAMQENKPVAVKLNIEVQFRIY